MCGITFLVEEKVDDVQNMTDALLSTSTISHRGPDRVRVEQLDPGVHMGFSRLCINDLSRAGDQPFVQGSLKKIAMVCNGEIYNHKNLQEKYKITCNSQSDCEIILQLYLLFKDVNMFVDELDGVFAFVIYDGSNQTVHVARDLLGIRPLFWIPNQENNKSFGFASEAKALIRMMYRSQTSSCRQFPAGYSLSFKKSTPFTSDMIRPFATRRRLMYHKDISRTQKQSQMFNSTALRNLLHSAVKKRLMSCRSIGCLLSGGLDSSLITSIVVREMASMKVKPHEINTYSVGMPGSVDLKNARIVADFLGTNHHEVLLSEDQFLNAIPKTIWHIESMDVTTVRASVGNLLVSKYIAENTNDKVIFNGDVADELFASYLGFCRAPNKKELQKQNILMLANIHFFDVLRSDRCISGAGLEARTPFADKALATFVMNMDPESKFFGAKADGRMEKHALRTAFMEGSYLPASILWRKKEAFSDGVSSTNRSWYRVAQRQAFKERIRLTGDLGLKHRKPNWTDERWWYTHIFNDLFGSKYLKHAIPYQWKHPFSPNTNKEDPSARQLNEYNKT